MRRRPLRGYTSVEVSSCLLLDLLTHVDSSSLFTRPWVWPFRESRRVIPRLPRLLSRDQVSVEVVVVTTSLPSVGSFLSDVFVGVYVTERGVLRSFPRNDSISFLGGPSLHSLL